MIKEFLEKLEIVAISPMAFVAYVILVIGWLYVTVRAKRFSTLQKVIQDLKYEDKVKVIEHEFDAHLSVSATPKEWLKKQKMQYVFWGFLTTIVVLVMAFAIQTKIVDPIKNYTQYQDEELIVESKKFVNTYYQSLINKNFDAYKYFSPKVEKFFLMENTNPEDINHNINSIYYKEFINPSLTAFESSWTVLDKFNDSCILSFIASESWFSRSKNQAVNIKSRYILKLDKRFKISYLRASEILSDSRRKN